MTSPYQQDFASAIYSNPGLVLDAPDLAWVTQAWVPGHLRVLSRAMVERAENTQWNERLYWRVPLFDIENTSSTRPFAEKLSVTTKTYSTGFHKLQDIMFARYLGAIDHGMHDSDYGERHYKEGFNGIQFGPSFDVLLTGKMFNAQGLLQSKLVDSHLWPQRYKIFDLELDRTVDYVYSSLTLMPKDTANGQVRVCEVAKITDRRSDCQQSATSLVLRRFTLADDELPRYSIDAGLPTCLVNSSQLNRNLRVYVGRPNYMGCNNSIGPTPSTSEEAAAEVVADDGFTQGIDTSDSDFIPLPLDQRAEILGEQQFQTAVDIEPVSGFTFQRESSLTKYFELLPTAYQYRKLPRGMMLPLLTRRDYLHRPEHEAQALDTLLSGTRRAHTWTKAFLYMLGGLLLYRALVLLHAGYSSPELRKVASRCTNYKEKLEHEAYEAEMDKYEKKLSKAKTAYESAVAKYEERKSKIESKFTKDALEELADTDVPLKGIGKDGKVFEFKLDEYDPAVNKR